MTTDQEISIIGNIPFLKYFNPGQLTEFIASGKRVVFKKDELIFNEGDPGSTMYIILSGSIDIFKQNKQIAVRSAGDYFGEMAMIELKPRSASARAIQECILFEIDQTIFDRFLNSNTRIVKEFLQTISGRCRVDLDIIDTGYLEMYKSEERYRTIVETISDIVIQVDPEGAITFVNSAIKMLGYSPQDLIGESLKDILLFKDNKTSMEDLLTRRIGPRATSNSEVYFKVKEDSTVYEFLQEVPFLVDCHGLWNVRNDIVLKEGSQKNFLGTLCIARDFTERKKFEDKLIDKKEELEKLVHERTLVLEMAKLEAERANQAKSDFLSSISHELRTPLNAILGFCELLQLSSDIALPEKEAGFLGHINQAGNHLLSLIQEILDLSKIESNETELEIRDFDVTLLINNLVSIVTTRTAKANITINNSTDKSGPVFVKADETKLNQVLLNLLTNAIKYNKKDGEVSVSLKHLPQGKVEISVEDTGYGISKEDHWKVFEPFQRLTWEYSAVEGTGIGLTISKKLMELMDGSIGFSSVPDQGSRFYIQLPPGQNSQHQKTSAVQEPPKSRKEASTTQKILYIEDKEVNIELVDAIISKQSNLELLSALNGKEGIDAAIQESPDLILLDIQLPDMNGFQILEKLKSRPETKDIPVVALSALAMKEDIEKGLENGFEGYLTKPLKVDIFLKMVFDTLDRNYPSSSKA